MGQSTPHQTSDTTGPSSGAENEFGVMDTHGHTTLYYIPQLLPQPETTILNTPVAFTSNIACGCQIEKSEAIHVCHTRVWMQVKERKGNTMQATYLTKLALLHGDSVH